MMSRDGVLIVLVGIASLFIIVAPVGGWIATPIENVLRSPASHVPATPASVSFQGVLTDVSGAPLPDGPYSVTFRIFDADSSGTELWTETQNVTLASGVFSTLLGSNTALTADVFRDTPRYLEVQVGADPPMTPRQQFTAVPYAFFSEGAGVAEVYERLGHSTMAVDTIGDVGQYTAITIGVDGLPIISYYDVTNGDLKVAHCGNAACTSGNAITTVDSGGDVGQHSSITIGADGFPAIAYYDATNGDLKIAKCGGADCSNGNTIATLDSAGDVGRHASMMIGVDGLPIVSYYDATDGDLKAAHCGNSACTASNTVSALDTSGDVGQHTSISMSAGDAVSVDPLIIYYDATNGHLKATHCQTQLCSPPSVTTITLDSSPQDVGAFVSTVTAWDGHVLIAYFESTGKNLRTRLCGNRDCTSSSGAINLDPNGDVGMWTSISHSQTRNGGVIAYYDSGNGDLKIARCWDGGCSSASAVSAADTTGDVGAYVSLSIGTDGLPVASYYDATNGDLKVAHCANVFCFPYNRQR